MSARRCDAEQESICQRVVVTIRELEQVHAQFATRPPGPPRSQNRSAEIIAAFADRVLEQLSTLRTRSRGHPRASSPRPRKQGDDQSSRAESRVAPTLFYRR